MLIAHRPMFEVFDARHSVAQIGPLAHSAPHAATRADRTTRDAHSAQLLLSLPTAFPKNVWRIALNG
jgi:hypothetical protein